MKAFMKRKILLLAIALIICVSIPTVLLAEEKLSLQTIISMALQNDKKYKINIERTTETRKKVLESWGGLWPQLQSDVGYSKQNVKQGITAPIKDEIRFTIVDGQITINPGNFYNTLQSSRDAHIVAEYTARQTKAETILQAINYFFQLILSEDNVELGKWSAQALKENFNIIAVGERKGLFTKFDYLQAKVSYYNEQTKLINAENTLSNDRANLNLYIGRSIYSKILVDRKSIDETLNEVSNYLVNEKTEQRLMDNFIASALKNRPEVFQFKYNKQMEIHNALASESYYLWPSFNITGNYGYNKVERESPSTESKLASASSLSSSLGWIAGCTWRVSSAPSSSRSKSKSLSRQHGVPAPPTWPSLPITFCPIASRPSSSTPHWVLPAPS